jgi:hypothetical protein
MSTVKATFDGFVGLNGVPVLLHDGDEYDMEHPLVQAHPDLFTEPATRRQVKQQQQTVKKATDG